MKRTTPLTTQAVLKSFEIGVPEAARIFDLDEDELLTFRHHFIQHEYNQLHAVEPESSKKLGWFERIEQSPWFDLAKKLFLALALIVISWKMPVVLQPYVDPLTNTVVWLGFTSLYVVTFIGIGIELVFFAQHNVNFEFLNPLTGNNAFDYSTLLKSDQLSAYEKCKLSQQKYMAYLAAYCLVILALASLTTGGVN